MRCHVPDWRLDADNRHDADYTRRYPGDRRFFNLAVRPSDTDGKLEGKLEWLAAAPGRAPLPLTEQMRRPAEPRRGAFTIAGVYSDFLHHDLGPAFHQMQFDGSIIKAFRTAPLWGVGSTAPYGHDGASLDLDDVIRRHGGESAAESKAYAQLSESDRLALLEFLRGLVLYSVDDLPCDINGDGTIAAHFIVAGQDTGGERLNPEWLFRVPGRIEGDVTNPQGITVRSFALTNAPDAYGVHLKYLEDTAHQGFPDARFAPRTGCGAGSQGGRGRVAARPSPTRAGQHKAKN